MDIRAHTKVRSALRTDTPRSVRVEAVGAEVETIEASTGTYVAALRGHGLDLAIPLPPSGLKRIRLKKAFDNTPEAQSREFEDTVMDYFLYYFPDRDGVAKWMLIDAFVGFVIGIDEVG